MRKLFAPFALYKRDAVLSVIGTVGEVVMEVFMPFITAYFIDRGIEAGDMDAIFFYGGVMLVMASGGSRRPGTKSLWLLPSGLPVLSQRRLLLSATYL